MAVVLVETPGAANANTYCARAVADAYHETHVSTVHATTWTEAAPADKDRALVHATRLLDVHIDWFGEVATETQRLLLPRDDLYGPNGYLVPSTEVPELVQFATAELARQLLAEDRTADLEQAGIERLKAGPVELSFTQGYAAKVLPDAVWDMVRAFGRRKAGAQTVVALVRR